MQIEAACQQSSHNCIHKNARIYCTECSMSVSVGAKHLLDLLKSSCIPTCKNISYHVGNRFTHPTHSVVLYGGVFFYTACGATAVNKLVKLFDPCLPLRYGNNYNLKAYKAGKALQGLPSWPYKHTATCSTTLLSSIRESVDCLAVAQREHYQDVSSEEEWPESDGSGLCS